MAARVQSVSPASRRSTRYSSRGRVAGVPGDADAAGGRVGREALGGGRHRGAGAGQPDLQRVGHVPRGGEGERGDPLVGRTAGDGEGSEDDVHLAGVAVAEDDPCAAVAGHPVVVGAAAGDRRVAELDGLAGAGGGDRDRVHPLLADRDDVGGVRRRQRQPGGAAVVAQRAGDGLGRAGVERAGGLVVGGQLREDTVRVVRDVEHGDARRGRGHRGGRAQRRRVDAVEGEPRRGRGGRRRRGVGLAGDEQGARSAARPSPSSASSAS